MNEDAQIRTIIANAKAVPKKVGVFVDDYKEERFLKKLRAGLPAEDFLIESKKGLTPKTRMIFITRITGRDPSAN